MISYDKIDLEEALRAIVSTIGKCEKVMPKLKPNSSQRTLLERRIKALQISAELIRRELSNLSSPPHERIVPATSEKTNDS